LDVFQSVFAKDPDDQEAWEKYRRGILEHGGAYGDEVKMLDDFLGRPSNSDALVEYLSGSS
jgi:metallopeptidase MepB